MSEFDKIIGYEDIKLELMRFCDVLRNPEKYAKLGVSMPSGLFLHGDPGLGKTLMAKCFITESGCKSFTIRKEKPKGAFIDKIRETFESAKAAAPSIVFLDDVDKFANEDENHQNAEEYVTVQACIDDCKEQGVFVLATANDITNLPESLLRSGRFDKIIEVVKSAGKEAHKIIESFLRQKKMVGDIDYETASMLLEGHSCAEIETIVNEAGIIAGFEGREKIGENDIIRALLRMVFKVPECVSGETEETPEKVAVHEAGHTVVAEILAPKSVRLIAVNSGKGAIGGITKIVDPIGYEKSIVMRENKIMYGLGGRAATEVVYGEADMGAGSDLSGAFAGVDYIVGDMCAYGFENCDSWVYPSEDRGQSKSKAINSELNRLYTETKRIIFENRQFLDALTSALVERKTLTYKDIQKIKERTA